MKKTLRNRSFTSMSLIVASFAMTDASSCGDISRESPVDNLPICDMRKNGSKLQSFLVL